MSRGINKVILVGNLGQDPEVRYTQSGSAVCNITVATSETWKDKNTGEPVETTEWHRVVMFRRLAEIAAEYLTKGAKVYIDGRLQTRKWQDQQGQDRYTTEIVADQMQMLDSRPSGAGQGAQPARPAPQTRQQPNRGNGATMPPPAQSAPPAGAYDDDIPFYRVPDIYAV